MIYTIVPIKEGEPYSSTIVLLVESRNDRTKRLRGFNVKEFINHKDA